MRVVNRTQLHACENITGWAHLVKVGVLGLGHTSMHIHKQVRKTVFFYRRVRGARTIKGVSEENKNRQLVVGIDKGCETIEVLTSGLNPVAIRPLRKVYSSR